MHIIRLLGQKIRAGDFASLAGEWAHRLSQISDFQHAYHAPAFRSQTIQSDTTPPITANVKTWAEAHNLEVDILAPPQSFTRRLPHSIEPKICDAYQSQLSYGVPEKYLVRLPHVRLAGANGMVILPDGSYALELAFKKQNLLKDKSIYGKPLPRGAVKKRGIYYSLLLVWANTSNYYHWMHDVLLRLYMVLDKLPKAIRFVVPANLPPFKLETLRILGISDRVIPFDGTQVWELEMLYFSPPSSRSGLDSPDADAWLRDLIQKSYGIAPRPAKRILISRKFAKKRRITNESEMQSCLEGYGFETCYAEQLTFQEQVALFTQSEIVIGSHGAGFMNLLFAPPGTQVLEIFEPSNLCYPYWIQSEALGHSYWYMFGETVKNFDRDPDIFVPIDKLERALAQLLSK